MKTFNVEVRFTPANHAATNGAIEKRSASPDPTLRDELGYNRVGRGLPITANPKRGGKTYWNGLKLHPAT